MSAISQVPANIILIRCLLPAIKEVYRKAMKLLEDKPELNGLDFEEFKTSILGPTLENKPSEISGYPLQAEEIRMLCSLAVYHNILLEGMEGNAEINNIANLVHHTASLIKLLEAMEISKIELPFKDMNVKIVIHLVSKEE